MSYARQAGESTEQYVSRIRSEAANGTISSGPGGSLIQSSVDQARGFGKGSGGAGAPNQSVQDNFYNSLGNPTYQAANQNQRIGGSASMGLTPYNTNVAQTQAQAAPAGTPTSTPNLTPGMSQDEFDKARQSILYNLSNPEFALTNVLNAKGLSLYNPVIRRGILPAAQGLSNAYAMQGALDPNAGPGTDVAGGLSSFIQNALNGAGGGIRGVTQGALGNLGTLGNTLWSAANAKSAGAVPTNPFIGALLSTLYDPQALTGLQTSLALPNLGPALTSGLQELLGLKSNQAWQQIQPNENFYKYLTP